MAVWTISTSFMDGTGLKKWMPTRRVGSFMPEAISARDRLEVLVPSRHSPLTRPSSCVKMLCFTSTFSTTASTITSRSARSPILELYRIFARVRSISSCAIFPFSTRLRRELSMWLFAFSSWASATS